MANKKNLDPYQLINLSAEHPMCLIAFNSGSLSVRYDYFDTAQPKNRLSGIVSGIGDIHGQHHLIGPDIDFKERVVAKDHRSAIDLALDKLAELHPEGLDLSAVGHRVLFDGGEKSSAAIVDDALLRALIKAGYEPWRQEERLMALAQCRERLPEVPQVAVFDSAFFNTLPQVAELYGIPYRYYQDVGLKKFGFQGLSHKYAAMRAATYLKKPLEEVKIITAHLGNGASLSAIDHGRAIDTTMGLTPLDGLIMCQRSGHLDPGLILHLQKSEGLSVDRLAQMLDRESGLLGISGISHDMQTLIEKAKEEDQRALLAIQVFCYQARKSIGAMATALNGFDSLIFTAGIGENAPGIRARICQNLGHLGLMLDDDKNRQGLADDQEVVTIEHPKSKIRVLLVRSDEARMIARETTRALGRVQLNRVLDDGKKRPIPIGVSAHHVHLTQEHVEALFGPKHQLTPKAPLSQPNQFACEELVNLIGPRGKVERVRVLGPVRSATQVEISRTEEFQLGIDAPVRNSGNVTDTPGITLEGDYGTVVLEEGVICARRHVHMHPDDAKHFGVLDKDIIMVDIAGDRSLVFGDVLVRVKDSYILEMHLDTDEANAGEISSGMMGRLRRVQSRPL
jgi:acetate kinase